MVIGALVRAVFFPLYGFKQDFLFFTSWADFLTGQSVTAIYDDPAVFEHGLINYPPLYLYMLAALGRMYEWTVGGPLVSRGFLALLKTATLAFEALTAWLIFRHAERRGDGAAAWKPAALYFLNPAVIYVSAYYGQVDAVFAALAWASVFFLLNDRWFSAGALAGAALAMKIQTLPFLPLLFFIPLARGRPAGFAKMAAGFALALALALAPYIATGRAGLVVQRCFAENMQWSSALTVGAFNLWYLHANPFMPDDRIWGWLYGGDGMVEGGPLLSVTTYKTGGLALFAMAYAGCLASVWRKPSADRTLLAFAHLALAFYLFPTKVHERYLFPFFVFLAPLVPGNRGRAALFWGFTLTYLANLYVICPLFGVVPDVEEVDVWPGAFAAAANLAMYAAFLLYEYAPAGWGVASWRGRAVLALGCALALSLVWARREHREPAPGVLYLSHIDPAEPPQQDWPPLPPEFNGVPPDPYYQVGRDESSDGNELRVRDTRFRYGLGVHANSRLVYEVPGPYALFETYIGVDREVLPDFERYPDRASVVFEVRVNGETKYVSPLMLPTMPARRVAILLPPHRETHRIELIARDGDGRNFSDHANWALARAVRGFRPPGDLIPQRGTEP